MGTNVQEIARANYTDSSGKFGEGMRVNDVEKFSIFERILYQTDTESGFRKLDTDGDGVLSHDEITAEIQNDIDSNKLSISMLSGMGLLNAIVSYGIRKSSPKASKLGLATAILSLGMVIYDKIKINKLEQRIADGHN